MADFSALIASIEAYVKQNGNNEITGNGLQTILDAIVNVIGGVLNDTISDLSDEVTARQNGDGTLQDNIDTEALARAAADTALDGRIMTIEEKIPTAATSENQLADKAFVNALIGALSDAVGAIEEKIPTDASDENQLADKAFVSALIAGITALIPSTASSLNKLADKEFVTSLTDALQNTINALKGDVKNGYVYAGIAKPWSAPTTGKVFYFATTRGRYTNFGNIDVPEGINIIRKSGSTWISEFVFNSDELRREIVDFEKQIRNLICDYKPIIVNGNVTNAPDEVDLTAAPDNLLKFKNKAYNPVVWSGLGKKYLRKNIIPEVDSASFDGFVEDVPTQETLSGTPDGIFWDRINETFVGKKDDVYYKAWTDDDDFVPVSTELVYMYDGTPYRWDGADMEVDESVVPTLNNILTQSMLSDANTIYIIQYDYDLNGETITIPENCVLKFEGGRISNGVIVGQDTIINELGCISEFEGTFIKDGQFVLPNSADKIEDIEYIESQKSFESALLRAEHENVSIVLDSKHYHIARRYTISHTLKIVGTKGTIIDGYTKRLTRNKGVLVNNGKHWCCDYDDNSAFQCFTDSNNKLVRVSSSPLYYTSQQISPDRGGTLDGNNIFRIDISDYDSLKNISSFDNVYGYVDSFWNAIHFLAISSDSQYLTCKRLDTPSASLNWNLSGGGKISFRLYNTELQDGCVLIKDNKIYLPIEADEVFAFNATSDSLYVITGGSIEFYNLTFQNHGTLVNSYIGDGSIIMKNNTFRNISYSVYKTIVSSNNQRQFIFLDNNLFDVGLNSSSALVIFQSPAEDEIAVFYPDSYARIERNTFINSDRVYYRGDAYGPFAGVTSAVIICNTSGQILNNTIVNASCCGMMLRQGNIVAAMNTIYNTDAFNQFYSLNCATDRGGIYITTFTHDYQTALNNTLHKADINRNKIYNLGGSQIRADLVRGIYIDDGRGDVSVHENLIFGIPGHSVESRKITPNSSWPQGILSSSVRNKIQNNVVGSSYLLDYFDNLTGTDIPLGRHNILLANNSFIPLAETKVLGQDFLCDQWRQVDNDIYILYSFLQDIGLTIIYDNLKYVVCFDYKTKGKTFSKYITSRVPGHLLTISGFNSNIATVVNVIFTGYSRNSQATFVRRVAYKASLIINLAPSAQLDNASNNPPTTNVAITDLECGAVICAAKAFYETSGDLPIVKLHIYNFNEKIQRLNWSEGLLEVNLNNGADVSFTPLLVDGCQALSGEVNKDTEMVAFGNYNYLMTAVGDLGQITTNCRLYGIVFPYRKTVIPYGDSARLFVYRNNCGYYIPTYGNSLPVLTDKAIGEITYSTYYARLAYWNGEKWLEHDNASLGVARRGTKEQRPDGSKIYIGYQYMQVDSQNGTFPIWASDITRTGNGTELDPYVYTVSWVKADGSNPDVM